ncbi:MAG: TatD family hydrolase [bacterium]|nr:TatD family hydrolase [bacterium]
MIIDTHTHLYAREFDHDRDVLIQKAIAGGITKFYLPNIDSASIAPMLALEQKYPEHCFAMMGLHPCHVNAGVEQELAVVNSWLQKRHFAAIGEIGIDLYWDKTFFEEQKHAFKTQIQWALHYGYPIAIHCREAFDPILEILTSFKTLPKTIFHCFSGNLEQAQQLIALANIKLGIGGVLTFKNSGLDKVLQQVALEHLVLETDAPYLAPVPFRGKRNEPLYLLEIAKKLAALKDLSFEEVSKTTSQNSQYVFEKG